MIETVEEHRIVAHVIAILCGSLAYGIIISALLINYGSRGCFCDIIQNGLQTRILDVDADDLLLLAKIGSIQVIDVDGPLLNLHCLFIKLTFTVLTEKLFKRKRPVMNESGDNWRVGLIES